MEVLKQDIEKLNYMIEHAKSKSQKREFIFTLECLYGVLNEIERTINAVKINDSDLQFLIKSEVANKSKNFIRYAQDDYREFIKSLSKNSLQHLDFYDDELFFKERFNLQDTKTLLIDFFNSFDKDLYPIVKKALDDEHLFLVNDRKRSGDGFSVFNPYSSNPYTLIFTDDKLQLNSISCLAHELGHAIDAQKTITNPKLFNQNIYSSMMEVPSFTFEFMFLDFLLENNIHPLEVEKIIYNNMTTLHFYLTCLQIINRVITKLNLFDDYELKDLQKILRSCGIFKTNTFCELCFCDIICKYSYSYGQLLATYFLTKYKQDKENTKNDIFNFINSIGLYDDLAMFERFGIDIEVFKKCDYLKDYTDRNIKQLTKNTQIY